MQLLVPGVNSCTQEYYIFLVQCLLNIYFKNPIMPSLSCLQASWSVSADEGPRGEHHRQPGITFRGGGAEHAGARPESEDCERGTDHLPLAALCQEV